MGCFVLKIRIFRFIHNKFCFDVEEGLGVGRNFLPLWDFLICKFGCDIKLNLSFFLKSVFVILPLLFLNLTLQWRPNKSKNIHKIRVGTIHYYSFLKIKSLKNLIEPIGLWFSVRQSWLVSRDQHMMWRWSAILLLRLLLLLHDCGILQFYSTNWKLFWI